MDKPRHRVFCDHIDAGRPIKTGIQYSEYTVMLCAECFNYWDNDAAWVKVTADGQVIMIYEVSTEVM